MNKINRFIMNSSILKKDKKDTMLTTTTDGWELSTFEGQYGPCISGTLDTQKRFLSITKEQFEQLNPEMAIRLWNKSFIGTHEGDIIEYLVGKFGGYIKWKGKNYNSPIYPSNIQVAIDIIQKKESTPAIQKNNNFWKHEDDSFQYQYGEGQYGPYIRITHKTNNVTKFVSWKPEDGEVTIDNIFKKLQTSSV